MAKHYGVLHPGAEEHVRSAAARESSFCISVKAFPVRSSPSVKNAMGSKQFNKVHPGDLLFNTIGLKKGSAVIAALPFPYETGVSLLAERLSYTFNRA
ncbi:hypothetical protein A3842_15555 [Paenibacillus sp. P3E]|uniref:hypothetical protein n=1 Tax=unclassified Paenibacillus TaxID=185978 RepID=UPI0009614095|nr:MULTISPECIES: hypothetical protein [unclassified Paenibacillus]OKP77811.1 hypothetical protein A3842_15555 [Paenibacillus sp. P3E]OKP92416.1 hypothetical protein A3848_08110 [Paenibacillus sp. P32E]